MRSGGWPGRICFLGRRFYPSEFILLDLRVLFSYTRIVIEAAREPCANFFWFGLSFPIGGASHSQGICGYCSGCGSGKLQVEKI